MVIVELAIAFYKKSAFVYARLLKRKKDGSSANNNTWEEVEVAKSEYPRVSNFSENNVNDDNTTS